jgi:hypothetical protein
MKFDSLKSLLFFPLFVVACQLLLDTLPAAAAEGANPPRKWALLIGAQDYKLANPLQYTVNDVRQVAESLRNRGDYQDQDILEIYDNASEVKNQPLRASLLETLPDFLSRPKSEDHILVYFSGHGFRDQDGKLYLAPIDCDPKNPAPTGIAVEWFRQQLAQCRAKVKLLILDACHAGTEKGADDLANFTDKDLEKPFGTLEGVITLASSTGEEKSLIWQEKQQSLFSYWLNQGIKGSADSDGDGVVNIDELFNYVYGNVTHTAKTRFPRSQTPVRVVRSAVMGVPEVIRLKPQALRVVLNDLAEQVAWAAEERKLGKLGVLEFTSDTKLGELLGADFGLLGRYCAEELEHKLMSLGKDKFNVVDRRRLQKALKDKKFSLDDLGSPQAMKEISEQAGGMPAIALGTLRNRTGRVVTLQCKLLQTESDELASSAGGIALLNENEWAMLGHSVQVKPDDYRPTVPQPGTFTPPIVSSDAVTDTLIERMEQRAGEAHPMLNPDFPFRVKIMVSNGPGTLPTERTAVFRGNNMYVPLRKNEVYEVYVENRSGKKVMMRLLVDGLNTQPELIRTKMFTVEEKPTKADWLAAVRVNLDEARPWILDPKNGSLFAVRGFFSRLPEISGDEGTYGAFTVVDGGESEAGRQNFTDQLGLITAAFYAPKSSSRGVGDPFGTKYGREGRDKIELQKGVQCGNLLAVVHIHYVAPEVLDRMQ